MESRKRGAGVEEAGKEDVGSTVIREAKGSDGKEETAVGIGEAMEIAEGMDDAGDVEGIRAVAAEAEAVEKAQGFVGVVVLRAEAVNSFRPIRAV